MTIEGFSDKEKDIAIQLVEIAAQETGNWITGYKVFSDEEVKISLESYPGKLERFLEYLSKSGISFNKSKVADEVKKIISGDDIPEEIKVDFLLRIRC